ncbi:actin cytoskeleton-regulatory complex protein PAN1-like [Aplysia californica]|uniref:Actin cytoskeleton-regulatory complex protein PAN1-like n=1 Tax=Aplysia californica TaxID=6500 RepID=A0ABM1W215_APLCA|nr:actin cytoskeleton-regulatory complex protein PAN1-like [Aplysia californica]
MALGCVLPVSCSSPLQKVCSLGAAQIKQEPPSCEYIQADPRLPVMCEHKMRDSKISVLKSTKMVLEDLRDQQLTSWTSRHPQHWSREQVLDWIYYVVEQEHLDGSRVRGEAYQSLTGSELCTMTEEDFRRIDPDNGSRLSAIFRHLLNNVTFIEPKPAPEGSSLETFNREHSSQHNALSLAVCSEAYAATRLSPCGGNDLIVYERENEMQVDIPSLGTYSISPDIEFPTTPSASSLFRSSASRLASSASFTSPPPSSSSSSSPCPDPQPHIPPPFPHRSLPLPAPPPPTHSPPH